MQRILVLGGYGLFGSRVVRALAADTDMQICVAGRDLARAQAFCADLPDARATLIPLAIDAQAPDFGERLRALRPQVVIDTAGPFQSRVEADTTDAADSYRVPAAILAAGAHSIDLADSRAYVRGIGALDDAAKTAGRWAISGASSVPALTAAVIEAQRNVFARLEAVEAAIAPGNRTPRGWATTLAILSYAGQPYRSLIDGAWRDVHGWQSLRRLRVDGIDTRWLARCEVPDLDLLPARYPDLRTVEFRAGLELRRMHLGLWLATWAVRAGFIRNLATFAKPLFRLSEYWQRVGSDTGLMCVTLRGLGHDGAALRRDWTLIARNGDGPQIPATATVLLARKLLRGELPGSGATPCLDLFALDEFLRTLDGYAMQTCVKDTEG
jgi:hypothetical protein